MKRNQYIYTPRVGYYQLTDFNFAQFLQWNVNTNTFCPFHRRNIHGNWHAPEQYTSGNLSEKVDVFSLGNVLYSLLTQTTAWKVVGKHKIEETIVAGRRAPIPDELLHSTDPFHVYTIQAMNQCWIQDPLERPSAYDISQILAQGLATIG